MKLEWVFDSNRQTFKFSDWDLVPVGHRRDARVVGLKSDSKPMKYWVGAEDYPYELPVDMTVDEAKVFLERQYLLMR